MAHLKEGFKKKYIYIYETSIPGNSGNILKFTSHLQLLQFCPRHFFLRQVFPTPGLTKCGWEIPGNYSFPGVLLLSKLAKPYVVFRLGGFEDPETIQKVVKASNFNYSIYRVCIPSDNHKWPAGFFFYKWMFLAGKIIELVLWSFQHATFDYRRV
jgi:hypothetical protein